MPGREIPFEGVLNFRDLGGYAGMDGRTVRWHKFYRSMSPEWMTEADLERARRELKIGLVIDLRGPDRSSGPLASTPARRVAIDVAAGPRSGKVPRPPTDDHEMIFPWFLKAAAPQLVEAIETCAVAHTPLLFHCHTGKDRTGFLAAAILGVAGVSDEDIVTDYLMSVPHFEPMMQHLREMGAPIPPEAPRMAQDPPTEAGIRAALAFVNSEFGGFQEYLLASGATQSALDRLAEAMLE